MGIIKRISWGYFILIAICLCAFPFKNAHAAQCGYASGNSYSSAPQSVGSLCVAGTASGVTGVGPWNWTCSDGGGAVNCSSGLCGVTPGVCNNAVPNGCTAGSPINVTSDASYDYWVCSGSVSTHNSGQCQKPKAPACPTGGAIYKTTAQCNADGYTQMAGGGCTVDLYDGPGNAPPYYTKAPAGSCIDRDYGRAKGCSDSSTGAELFRIYLKPGCGTSGPAPVAGACNNSTVNGCSSGSAVNITSNASNDYWYCSGTNGGADSPQCSKAKPVTYTYSWIQGGFGACSASCGGGTQTQSVVCRRNDGADVADSFCGGGKPATSQSCNTQACQVGCTGPVQGPIQNYYCSGNTVTIQNSGTYDPWATDTQYVTRIMNLNPGITCMENVYMAITYANSQSDSDYNMWIPTDGVPVPIPANTTNWDPHPGYPKTIANSKPAGWSTYGCR